jgi:pyruvate,water dikinase
MSSDSRAHQLVYFFGEGHAESGSAIQHLVGGKGASLAEMTRAGFNVPPGFTISAECCDLYYRTGRQWPAPLEEAVRANLARLEKVAGRPYGRSGDPFLLAVRSGAAQSMPGMMDTILNVGLNPDCVRLLAGRTGNARAAWEAYRHFLVAFGHTIGRIDESAFADLVGEGGTPGEVGWDLEQGETLCDRFRAAYRQHVGRDLPTDPWALLVEAINAVFNSWTSERAITYRQHHQIAGLLGTAVTIQMMCPAEVSGVMFTANPVALSLDQIVIESSYGLGEAIVLGKVTPDRYVVDKRSQKVIEVNASVKQNILPGLISGSPVQSRASDQPSLNSTQVEELTRLGLRVEEHFQRPCDIEWALSESKFYLLQARPIKGLSEPTSGGPKLPDASPPSGDLCPVLACAEEIEQIRREEIAALATKAEPRGTVWSAYNLCEVLREPTPMTWAVVNRFMSGRGGLGQMYRDLGFRPDPRLDQESVFDLVCGRPYCNLSREPLMYANGLPYDHPFAALKAAPQRALYPRPNRNPAGAGMWFWLTMPVRWPLLLARSVRSAFRMQALSRTFAPHFREAVVPPFLKAAADEAAQDLARLDPPSLLEHLHFWIQRTLHDFARDSLKPTILAALARDNLERLLQRGLGPERTRAALGELSLGVHPDPDADLAGAVRDLASGHMDVAAFRQEFGHRGPQEMELSLPRWGEDEGALQRLAGAPAQAAAPPYDWKAVWEGIATEAKLSSLQRLVLTGEVEALRSYLALRETGKHYLMRGYALIRRHLLELDGRFGLDGGIFYLTPEELPNLTAGNNLADIVVQRRRRRAIVLSLQVPQVLFSDDLDTIGRSSEMVGADVLQGVPLSVGMVEGPALVLTAPMSVTLPTEPYILVCPSTDPAWVPLFIRARGLVMETGGVLSHGAIVAREFGLPAVAGLPDVHRRLRTGQRLRIDGGTGRVNILA